jgi:hypothetical protein
MAGMQVAGPRPPVTDVRHAAGAAGKLCRSASYQWTLPEPGTWARPVSVSSVLATTSAMAIALPAEAVLTVLKNGNRQRALSLKLPPQHLGDLLPELPGDHRHHHLGREPGAVQHTGGTPAPILVVLEDHSHLRHPIALVHHRLPTTVRSQTLDRWDAPPRPKRCLWDHGRG